MAHTEALEAPGPDEPEEQVRERLVNAFLLVAEALTTEDANPADRRCCRSEVLRQVERTAPGARPSTDELLAQSETAMLRAADDRR